MTNSTLYCKVIKYCTQNQYGIHLQVLLLVLPGGAKASQVDAAGLSSLAVLRLMGLPALQVLVQGQAEASLKDRSAAKKRAHAAVASQVHTQTLRTQTRDYNVYFTCQLADKRQVRRNSVCLHEHLHVGYAHFDLADMLPASKHVDILKVPHRLPDPFYLSCTLIHTSSVIKGSASVHLETVLWFDWLQLLRGLLFAPCFQKLNRKVWLQIAGEHKVMTADTEADCQQVLRHLGEIHPTLPLWRQQRPALHLETIAPQFSTADASAGNVVIRYCHVALTYFQGAAVAETSFMIFVKSGATYANIEF